jgi:hypothetical protein
MAPKKDPNFPMQGKLGGMRGVYGRKAENLTAKELKKAGGAKASAARTVSISDTRRDTTRGITLGPKGQPLTGKVVLANGNVAVYKAGKRVIAAAAKKAAPSTARTPKTPVKDSTSSRAAAMKAAKADAAKRAAAGVNRTPSAARKAGAAADAKARMNKPRTEASIRSRNDSIRDAPLADIISKFKFGTSGKTVNSGKGPYSK